MAFISLIMCILLETGTLFGPGGTIATNVYLTREHWPVLALALHSNHHKSSHDQDITVGPG